MVDTVFLSVNSMKTFKKRQKMLQKDESIHSSKLFLNIVCWLNYFYS